MGYNNEGQSSVRDTSKSTENRIKITNWAPIEGRILRVGGAREEIASLLRLHPRLVIMLCGERERESAGRVAQDLVLFLLYSKGNLRRSSAILLINLFLLLLRIYFTLR